MPDAPSPSSGGRQAAFIRLGGVAVVVALAIHVVVNFFIKSFPPDHPTLEELRAYLVAEKESWALVHGLRYLAFPCIVLFASGLYTRICRTRPNPPTGWALVGVMGAAIQVTNVMMTNGIETLAFLDFEMLAGRAELFWTIFYLTRVLFTAEVVAWAIFIGGFSVAGWLSGALPRWIAGLGFLSATAGLVADLFIVSVMTDGWAGSFLQVAGLTGMAWYLSVGVYMMIKGDT